MTSSRIVLIFLGIIFLMIIILSSNRMIMGLRDRIGSILPKRGPAATGTPTPTKAPVITITATPSPIVFKTPGSTQGTQTTKGGVEKIPSTGASEIALFLLGCSFFGGLGFRTFSGKR